MFLIPMSLNYFSVIFVAVFITHSIKRNSIKKWSNFSTVSIFDNIQYKI